MSPASVQEYLKRMRERYREASKRQRGALLDEVCAVTGYHRKAAIRALGRSAAARKGRHGRAVVYGVAVVDGREQLWEASDRLSPKASWWGYCRSWWRPWSDMGNCSWTRRCARRCCG